MFVTQCCPFFQEVVLRFENQGDTTTHLEELKRENDKQIARLNEEKEKLQVEFEEMKYSGEAKLSRYDYREISNIRHTLVGNKIVDNSDVNKSPVGPAPTTSSFSTKGTPGFNRLRKDNCETRQETFKFWDLVQLILETWQYIHELLVVGL